MLKQTRTWIVIPPFSSIFMSFSLPKLNNNALLFYRKPVIQALNLRVPGGRALWVVCGARRSVRYEDEDEDEHNEEIAMLEFYTQSAREEALLVHAVVDEQEVEILIFKGFSSCLSYRTSPDPSKSVLPATAVIKSIDRIKGPFDPSNIEYLEKGLTLQAFQTSFGQS